MYTSQLEAVEPVCYEHEHQEKVLAVLTSEFEKAFPGFVETEAGQYMSEDEFLQLQDKFKVVTDKKKAVKNRRENFIAIIKKSMDGFEKNQQAYIDLLDPELLEEDDDYPAFKSKTLKLECPIIRATLFTDLDELKQYKIAFQAAQPKTSYNVVANLSRFSREYAAAYDENAYEKISSYEELNLGVLEEGGETYTAYGVIGGGIRSHMLYKVHPECFPNRSQWALWALWYLTNQESFDCEMDSEFL